MASAIRNLLNRDGRYFARIVVPKALTGVIGKTELRTSLGPDRRTAVQRLPAAVAGLRDILAAARASAGVGKIPYRPLDPTEIAQLHYQEELAIDENLRNLGSSYVVSPEYNEEIAAHREKILRRIVAGYAEDEEIGATVGWAIDQFIERGYTAAKFGSSQWRALARTLAITQIEALKRSLERDAGIVNGEPSYAPLKEQIPSGLFAEKLPLMELLEAFANELKKSGRGAAAKRRWRPCISSLTDFLKHDDARRLSRQDVLRWKEELLATLAAKTVRDSHLAALKAILQYAVDGGKLQSNVAADVKIRVPRPLAGRSKGFSNEEARSILLAASAYRPTKRANQRTTESQYTIAAKKWTAWLCALTGARVAEVTQLRKEDVRLDHEIPHIRITPEAGSVKTGQFREVPLHPQLLELGFGKFVRASDAGPLFFAPRDTAGAEHPSKQVAAKLAKWVRSLNVIPPDVDPHHGWRHKMKSDARDLGLDPWVIDAIQGHAARTAGEAYGHVSLHAKKLAIWQFPPYPLS